MLCLDLVFGANTKNNSGSYRIYIKFGFEEHFSEKFSEEEKPNLHGL